MKVLIRTDVEEVVSQLRRSEGSPLPFQGSFITSDGNTTPIDTASKSTYDENPEILPTGRDDSTISHDSAVELATPVIRSEHASVSEGTPSSSQGIAPSIAPLPSVVQEIPHAVNHMVRYLRTLKYVKRQTSGAVREL